MFFFFVNKKKYSYCEQVKNDTGANTIIVMIKYLNDYEMCGQCVVCLVFGFFTDNLSVRQPNSAGTK